MAELIARSKDRDDYENPTPGMVQAVCAFVEDIGTHESTYNNETRLRHQIVICFELAQTMTKGPNAGKPFMVSNFYTLSLGKKSTLAKDLESWFSKQLTEEQRKEGIDLKKLIGKGCTLNLIEKQKRDGTTGIYISGVLPSMPGAKVMGVYNSNPPQWIGEMRADSMEEKEAAGNHMAGSGGNSGLGDLPF